MAVDLEAKSSKDLQTIIENCVRLNQTSKPIYLNAKKILVNRQSGDLDMEKTIRVIIDHGKRGKFLSYKDISDASGLDWTKSRRRVPPHLDAVCFYSEGKGWPLITAIVVNKENTESGRMTPDNLKGFLAAARAVGRTVDVEEAAFVGREQTRVFEWCQREQ
jgi:hypothetical protein